jgi:transposase
VEGVKTHNYPSGITREEFEIIRADLERARKTTKPQKIDPYDVFCGLPYLLKSGCRRRMIPADFPKRNTISITVFGAKRKETPKAF